MNSPSTGLDSADAPSTSRLPQTSPAPVSAVARPSANADASSNDQQNPLWLIVAAMAVFFTAAAAILATG